MFDTLRFATRLKRSGFESGQAEGMARALSEEMGKLLERLATRVDLATMKNELKTQIAALSVRLDSLEAKFEALSARVDSLSARVVALEAKVEALSARVAALEAKVDAMAMQMKFMFAMLAVLLALGLIETVPGMLG